MVFFQFFGQLRPWRPVGGAAVGFCSPSTLTVGPWSHFSKQNEALMSTRSWSSSFSTWSSRSCRMSCEPLRKQLVPTQTLTLTFSAAGPSPSAMVFAGDAPAVLVMRVQQAMRVVAADFAQVLLVAFGDEMVLLRLVQFQVLVGVVQPLGARAGGCPGRARPAGPRRRCSRRGRPSLRSGPGRICRAATFSASVRAFFKPVHDAELQVDAVHRHRRRCAGRPRRARRGNPGWPASCR